jgi:hypothetical protein
MYPIISDINLSENLTAEREIHKPVHLHDRQIFEAVLRGAHPPNPLVQQRDAGRKVALRHGDPEREHGKLVENELSDGDRPERVVGLLQLKL